MRQQPCLLEPGSDRKDDRCTGHVSVFSLQERAPTTALAVCLLMDVEEAICLEEGSWRALRTSAVPIPHVRSAYVCRRPSGLHVPLEFIGDVWSEDTDRGLDLGHSGVVLGTGRRTTDGEQQQE